MSSRVFLWTPARVLVFGFAAVILLGGILLSLPVASRSGQGLDFLDALFTATSAVCVTGLVVVDTGTFFSHFGQIV
ncbi:MAG: Trk family potassium uptake protein, partial [Alicyclobacillaceae bacterium]|nr:Trk family potassium uptake protein [Alicyclobacillaceae bacterium]